MNAIESVVIPPDIAGRYAARVEQLLRQDPSKALTVPEIIEQLKCTERRVREALDRLAYERKIVIGQRHIAGHRGTMPREYALRSEPSSSLPQAS